MKTIQKIYKQYTFKIEQSGNVCVYLRGVFLDKFANVSEAQDRCDKGL